MNMTMIKKFLSFTALAAAALALPTAAQAAGDIVDIRVMDQAGKKFGTRNRMAGDELCSPDNPLIAGQYAYIRVRMLVRNYGGVKVGMKPQTWEFRNKVDHSKLSPGVGPSLGLVIGERKVYAEYVLANEDYPWQQSGKLLYNDKGEPSEDYTYFTDLYFRYTVQSGDMGLPVVLMGSDLQPVSVDGSGAEYAFAGLNCLGEQYELVGVDEDTGAIAVADVKLSMSTDAFPVEWPANPWGETKGTGDINLLTEGMYVKTVDFDTVYADRPNDIWRDVNRAGCKGSDAAIVISSGAKAPELLTVYVWSDDETVVKPEEGMDGVKIQSIRIGDATKQVLTVQVKEGETGARFVLKAVAGAELGKTAKVYMSPNLGSVYDAAGTLQNTAVFRTVKVVKDDPPGVCLRLDGVTTKTVTAGEKYMEPVARLAVRIENDSTARDQPVTVTLDAAISGDSSHATLKKIYSADFLRISKSATVDIDGEGGKTYSVEIPVGQSSVELYVFALGDNEQTANVRGGGILFTPTVTAGGIGLADDPTARLYVKGQGDGGIAVSQVTPASAVESPSEISMSAGDPKAFQVWFNDNYKNMFGPEGEDCVYYFTLVGVEGDYAGVTLATSAGATYKNGDPGYCKIPKMMLEDGIPAKENTLIPVELVGVAPDGSTTKPVPYKLRVIAGKAVTIELAQGMISTTVGEGDTVQFNFGLNREAESDEKFIFLKGVSAAETALFDSAMKTTGAQIGDDYQHVVGTREVTFLDGTKEVNLRAFVSTTMDDPTDLDKSWAEGKMHITVTNKPPRLQSLEIAGMPLTYANDNGDVLSDAVPMGVDKEFKIKVVDDVELDLTAVDDPSTAKDERFQTRWLIDGTEYITYGDPRTNTVVHAFATKTADGKKGQLVQVYMKDKDMVDFPATPNFQCWVKVSPKPFISITTSAIGGLLNEDDQGIATVSVTLSEPATEPIEVLLKVQRPTTGIFTLREATGSVEYIGPSGQYDEYKLIFKAGTEKMIIVSEMDGTNDTLAGLDLSASVVTEGWTTYYDEGSLVPPLRIQNVPPKILRPTDVEQAYTNEHASADVAYNVAYGAKDVKADLEAGIDVTIAVDGIPIDTSLYVNKLHDTAIHNASVTFAGEGAHVVEITFTDKDGMSEHATLNFFVQQSKRLQLRAHGPAGSIGSSGGYSAKYQGAKGLGAGRVFAGTGPQKVENFVHTYSFNVNEASVNAWAFGYKADPALFDNGSLDSAEFPGKDRGIDQYGNWSVEQEKKGISAWYNYANDNYTKSSTHKGAYGLDSFSYGWACNNSVASKDSDSGTESLVLSVGEVGEFAIPLPDSDDSGSGSTTGAAEKKSIPVQYWEAIFSCELLKGDNCGDINADGIPDRYVQLYRFDVLDESYAIAGDDLRDLNFTADEDSATPYCADGDYLPSTGRAAYSALIPGLPSQWGDETSPVGEAFTPVLKIRGFGDSYYLKDGKERISNLNDAPAKIGLTDIKPERIYTNPKEDENSTLSYVEWLAWSEFKAANPEATESDWSPENPTDPTKADTDRDGLTDGYEYWFWYMAHVGWIENYGKPNEIHKRLTGRRYDPRNPGQGTLITPEEIEIAMNPNSATGSKTRDTDNDGLPDIIEFEIGTNPFDFDTDHDGLPDGFEILINGTDPLLMYSAVGGVSDTERNYDGDAMAFTSVRRESEVLPRPLFTQRYNTFATVDADGDSDGIQWYAETPLDGGKTAFTYELVASNGTEEAAAALTGTHFTADGVDYVTTAKFIRTGGGCLAVTLDRETTFAVTNVTEETAAGLSKALGGVEFPEGCKWLRLMPTRLEAGIRVSEPEENAEFAYATVKGIAGGATCNAAWLYGTSVFGGTVESPRVTIVNTSGPEVYGMLALARYLTPAKGAALAALPTQSRDVALMHYLVYQQFGFDPRTAWNPNTPLAARWGKTANGEAYADQSDGAKGYAGQSTRTRAFTAYDEFLLLSFWLNNGTISIGDVTADDIVNPWYKIWSKYTTNPRGPNEPSWAESDHYQGRTLESASDTNGADTDQDGVPDGWELYVMAGPKKTDSMTKKQLFNFAPPYGAFTPGAADAEVMEESYFSPFKAFASNSITDNEKKIGKGQNDTLTELQEYAGTDSCAYYSEVQGGNTAAYSTTIVRPEGHELWLNKFFPTDPWAADTDDDGVNDGAERTAFSYATELPANTSTAIHFAGCGLNPCSVDTDCDGLPDGWEKQFTYTDGDAIKPEVSTNIVEGLINCMDGTVADAQTQPGGPNRDYDRDGLENWQEYLVGTMRCWRYDDPHTQWGMIPFEHYFGPDGFAPNFKALGITGETLRERLDSFWYQTLVDKSSPIYNPHLLFEQSPSAQYFSRVDKGWDPNYTDSDLDTVNSPDGRYYWFAHRIGKESYKDAWSENGYSDANKPVLYPSCSPINVDTDQDGMDDYYELFHGLNPLLGAEGGGGAGPCDVVNYIAADDKPTPVWSMFNWWVANPPAIPRGDNPDFDFTVYQWRNGLQNADADGDNERNYVESIMARMASGTWLHTDPSPMWMTDATYTNSLTRLHYRMPFRRGDYSVVLGAKQGVTQWAGTIADANGDKVPGFTHSIVKKGEDGTVTTNVVKYFFRDFDGIDVKAFFDKTNPQVKFTTFMVDRWAVGSRYVDTRHQKRPADGAVIGNWLYSFEENEGYDTDHDGVNDEAEVAGRTTGGSTDPLDADSPRRRQAMYFPGENAALQTPPQQAEGHPIVGLMYAAEIMFQQYTVECWVRPDDTRDSIILERTIMSDPANAGDKELIRKNFQFAIRGGFWFTKFDSNGTGKFDEVGVFSAEKAEAGVWTHLAATYDGKYLVLYVNGKRSGQSNDTTQSHLLPECGISALVFTTGTEHTGEFNVTYGYPAYAIIVGAGLKTYADVPGEFKDKKVGDALNLYKGLGWDNYKGFYKGYIDEIRIWDGARTAAEIGQSMGVRYDADLAKANRTAFYDAWRNGASRYTAAAQVPLPELRYHFTFDSLFAADSVQALAVVPTGFANGDKAPLARPDGYAIPWWQTVLDGYGSIYAGAANYVPWIHNTVAHLPRFDGTVIDSAHWSEDFAGDEPGDFKFANSADPYAMWSQVSYGSKRGNYGGTALRHYLANSPAYETTDFSGLFSFTGRRRFTEGEDLLPLGGAYAKYVTDMWDGNGPGTTHEVSGSDADSDGLPDWWEKYADENYRGSLDPSVDIGWNTVIDYVVDGVVYQIPAGEAYLRDLARGVYANDKGEIVVDAAATSKYRQTADADHNGIPDWWAKLYGIEGEAPYADHDNDGLPNYVEYMLSEVFKFQGVKFSPVRACSADPHTPDYFFRVGQVYVGEIFTDHDQVDDAWEDIYPNSFGSRLLYDAEKDADNDGWSNRAEVRYAKQCMPTQADKQTHYSAADGLVADYPIPTLALTLNYNGANATAVRSAPIVVQVTRNPLDTADPDATFVIGKVEGAQAGSGTSSQQKTDKTITALTRTLGKWSNRHAIGTLTPGYINKDSVALQFCYDPSSLVYTWEIKPGAHTGWTTKRGTRAEYDEDCRKYGAANVNLISRDTEYKELENVELRVAENSSVATWFIASAGLEFGTLDLTTGAFDLDLGAFAGQYVVDSSNETDYASMEDQTYRIAYSVNPAVDLPRKLYLGQADTGWVREGKNQVVAFADLDGSGTYTPGEPYGVVNGVDVSWKGTSATIELTEVSPVTPRIRLFGGEGGSSSGSSSRGGQSGEGASVAAYPVRTVDQIYTEIEEGIKAQNLPPVALSNALLNLSWMQSNVISTPTLSSTEDVRVRVVRWLVDGNPVWACGVEPRVVVDKKFRAGSHDVITEADILSDTALDLDWQYLRSEVVNARGVQLMELDVAEVDYLVVIGDGVTAFAGRDDTNNTVKALSQVICRRYGANRVIPSVVAPSAAGDQIVRDANPTFKWRMAEADEKGYTAFRVQVTGVTDRDFSYDSGVLPAPARDASGNYVWTAPLFVGDKGVNGKVYANNATYSWKVSMFNSKYTADSFSSSGTYLAAVQTNGFEYGTAQVAVRYFGPAKSYDGKTIRVRAYESPDFTGVPVAAGYVAAPDDAVTGVAVTGKTVTANCRVIGIPKGTYYLQAFIDSNDNGVCDNWESMGYLCDRSGNTADWLNPVGMKFGDEVGQGDLAVIYIEDADTDCDSLPDAWEYAKYGSLTATGVEAATLTKAGEAVVPTDVDLAIKLETVAGNDVIGGLAGRVMTMLSNSKPLAALTMGIDPEQVASVSADGVRLEGEVKDGTLKIMDVNFNREKGEIELRVCADVDAPQAGDVSPIYGTVKVADGATVTLKVLYSDNLAKKPQDVVFEKSGIVISSKGIDGQGLITVPVEGLADKAAGFVSVVVEQ